MLSELKSFWAVFKKEEQKAQIILILLLVAGASNWYWYNNVLGWVQRNEAQALKIDELQNIIIDDSSRYGRLIAISEQKADSCQAERIREHKAQIKKDSVYYYKTDQLYQKVNEILKTR